MKKRFAALTVMGLCSMAPLAQAFDWFGGRLSIGGGYGYDKPKLPYRFQDQYKEGPMWTIHTGYFINNDVSVRVSYSDLHAKNRTSTSDIHFRPLMALVRYNFVHHAPVTPYLIGGAGGSFNRQENTDGSTTRWTQLALQAGLGFEFFINESTSLGVEGLYNDFRKKNHNSYGVPSAVGMMNLYFGEGPTTRRAKEEAARQKERAEAAEAQARAAQQQTGQAMTEAEKQRQMAATAQQGALAGQAQLSQAEKDKAAAEAARLEAERKMAAMQEQTQQAQAEMDAIKQMIAHKDLQPVTFKTGSAELTATSSPTLDKVAETAKKYPNLKLRVEGHTDSQGSDATNMTLSQQRADAVRDYLVNTGGVPADQVVAAGFGESRPIASNETAPGRSENRRVEFIFFLK